jgi:hypothetical protein
LAIVAGATVLVGGGLVVLGGGIAAGAIAGGEGATAFSALEAEFGAEHGGALVAIAGGAGMAAGGGLAYESRC